MTNPISKESDRRTALRRIAGLATVPVGLPMLASLLNEVSLISPAEAHVSIHPGEPNRGNVLYIPQATASTSMAAEWNTGRLKGNDFRIGETKASIDKAPADASHYEATLYKFPCGNFRRLTYKKGGPILHMITHETEIFVLSGTATHSPFPGLPGKPVTLRSGDALFLPAGIFSSPKASEDFVILQGFVTRAEVESKAVFMTAKQVVLREVAEWEADGKPIKTEKPEEVGKAPKNAHRTTSRRYDFAGNAIYDVIIRGGRSLPITTSGNDQLIYCVKGRVRRKEGDQTFELAPGDCMRRKIGNTGYWEPLEETRLIATNALLRPNMPSPAVRGPEPIT